MSLCTHPHVLDSMCFEEALLYLVDPTLCIDERNSEKKLLSGTIVYSFTQLSSDCASDGALADPYSFISTLELMPRHLHGHWLLSLRGQILGLKTLASDWALTEEE